MEYVKWWFIIRQKLTNHYNDDNTKRKQLNRFRYEIKWDFLCCHL